MDAPTVEIRVKVTKRIDEPSRALFKGSRRDEAERIRATLEPPSAARLWASVPVHKAEKVEEVREEEKEEVVARVPLRVERPSKRARAEVPTWEEDETLEAAAVELEMPVPPPAARATKGRVYGVKRAREAQDAKVAMASWTDALGGSRPNVFLKQPKTPSQQQQ